MFVTMQQAKHYLQTLVILSKKTIYRIKTLLIVAFNPIAEYIFYDNNDNRSNTNNNNNNNRKYL